MFRGLVLITACALTSAVLAAEQPEVFIEFDKKAGQNPTCPAARQIKATGTFKLPPGDKFQKIEVTVARRGRPREGQRVSQATIDKAKPNAWSVVVENLDESGEYEVEARLQTQDSQGQNKVYETRDVRRVFVRDLKQAEGQR
jgi:hypothetical protein